MNEPKNKKAIDDDESVSILGSWISLLLSPSMMIHAIEDVFNSFISTRPWRRLLIFSPAILLLLVISGLLIYGAMLTRETLIERYAKLADQELERLQAENPGTEEEQNREMTLMKEEKSSTLSDMLYRRLLNLNDQNARTRYLVAMQMARSQRVGQARVLMEEIAQPGGKGYPGAHAWLAFDLLSRQPLSKDDQIKLMTHLEEIKDWDGAGSGLLAVHANLLATLGRHQESLDAMSKAVKKDPSLLSAYAIMARRFNMPKIADESADRAREMLKKAIRQPDAKLRDYVQLASLELTEEKFKEALEVTRTGLNTIAPNDDQLKYLGSEALRLWYRKSVRKTAKGLEFNLALLDAAMKEFPANPNLSAEIALLDEMGVEAPPAFKAALEQQLANGQATALAHLVLAHQQIKLGRLREAIPHLELCLKQAPNNPIALNNLAMSLALTDASNVKRAEELIRRAIEIDPRNPEFYDSEGQILLVAGRPLDAVSSLEKAIFMDAKRMGTRELIIKAYRAAQLEDLAVAQEKALAQLQLEAKNPSPPVTNASDNNSAAPTTPRGGAPTSSTAPAAGTTPAAGTVPSDAPLANPPAAAASAGGTAPAARPAAANDPATPKSPPASNPAARPTAGAK